MKAKLKEYLRAKEFFDDTSKAERVIIAGYVTLSKNISPDRFYEEQHIAYERRVVHGVRHSIGILENSIDSLIGETYLSANMQEGCGRVEPKPDLTRTERKPDSDNARAYFTQGRLGKWDTEEL